MSGGALDFQGPGTTAPPADRCIDSARGFKAQGHVASFGCRDHVAAVDLDWPAGGFFVASEHYDHAHVFERADVRESLQGVQENHVASLHVRTAVAVSFLSLASPVFALEHS